MVGGRQGMSFANRLPPLGFYYLHSYILDPSLFEGVLCNHPVRWSVFKKYLRDYLLVFSVFFCMKLGES